MDTSATSPIVIYLFLLIYKRRNLGHGKADRCADTSTFVSRQAEGGQKTAAHAANREPVNRSSSFFRVLLEHVEGETARNIEYVLSCSFAPLFYAKKNCFDSFEHHLHDSKKIDLRDFLKRSAIPVFVLESVVYSNTCVEKEWEYSVGRCQELERPKSKSRRERKGIKIQKAKH